MATHIMIVKDETEIRELLNFSRTRAGFRFTEAASAESALQKLFNQLPDLVIVDWMIQGMNGVDLAKRRKGDALTNALSLPRLTARSEEPDMLKSFGSGIDDYRSKPFSTKELAARIKALMCRSGVPESVLIEACGKQIDLGSHLLIVQGTNSLIGPTKYRLLVDLLDLIWGRGSHIYLRTFDVNILRLRKNT